ncbi:MAG: hypothetical protein J0H68_07700 [Sphingobacteriia bacterium]|nr:hypothetical protein [Sphingobacteriia bacterium]
MIALDKTLLNTLVIILLPLISSFISLSIKDKINLKGIINLIISGINSLLSIIVYSQIYNSRTIFHNFLNVTGKFSISLYIEPIGIIFIIFVNILWFINNLYTLGYIKQEKMKNTGKFIALINISIFCAILTALSGNLFTTLLGYELLTLFTFPLVKIIPSHENKQAANYYLKFLMFCSIAFLIPGILLASEVLNADLINHNSNTGFLAGISLILFTLGTAKSAFIPFHSWLPRAMVAPIPVSALLHAVAVVKTGVIIILKFIIYTVGVEETFIIFKQYPEIYYILATIICGTIFFSSIIAIKQDTIKGLLAYSTISQLSYILLPILSFDKYFIKASILQMITHGAAKITLFFAAGNIYSATKVFKISEMNGMGYIEKYSSALFIIACFFLTSFVPLIGFWSKSTLINSIGHNFYINIFLFLTSVLTILYLFKPINKFYFSEKNPSISSKRIHFLMKLAPSLSLITLSVFTFLFLKFYNLHVISFKNISLENSYILFYSYAILSICLPILLYQIFKNKNFKSDLIVTLLIVSVSALALLNDNLLLHVFLLSILSILLIWFIGKQSSVKVIFFVIMISFTNNFLVDAFSQYKTLGNLDSISTNFAQYICLSLVGYLVIINFVCLLCDLRYLPLKVLSLIALPTLIFNLINKLNLITLPQQQVLILLYILCILICLFIRYIYMKLNISIHMPLVYFKGFKARINYDSIKTDIVNSIFALDIPKSSISGLIISTGIIMIIALMVI